MESTLEQTGMDTHPTGNDYGINADVMRLLRSAVAGKFNSSMLPAGLVGSEFEKALINLNDARNAVDLNPIPMLVLDTDLNFIDANDSALELFGWSREETLRQNIKGLDILEIKGDSVAVAINEKRLVGSEVTLRCPKGVLTLRTYAAPLLDGNGNVRAALLELIDITAEKEVAENVVRYTESEVNRLTQNLGRLARGNLDFDLAVAEADEHTRDMRENFIRINGDLAKAKEALGLVIADTVQLTEAAAVGHLTARGDVSKHQGDFRAILEGTNNLLDAVVEPFETTLGYIDQIGRGEIPEKIIVDYRGDYNQIKISLNRCIEGLGGLAEANYVLQRMAINDHTNRVSGTYQGVFAEVAAAVNLVQDRVNHVAEVVERISHGNLSDRPDIEKIVGTLAEQDRLGPSVLRTLVTLETLTNDMAELTGAAQKGDLGKRVDITKHEGEYRKIVEGVNSTLDVIVDPFKRVQDAIIQLESSTQDTSKSSDEIAKAAEQVAVTSQKCADLSKQVLREIEGIESQMADLSASNEEIAGTAQEVLGATTETAEKGKESLKLGEATKDKMAIVEKISRQSTDEIVRLNSQMDEIGKIVKLINDIANQTNLLALNAAIEAARAGEHGRGFAVVAGEIRNLAGESKNASHNIEELIASIVTNSDQTAKNMEQVYQEIEEGVGSVNRTIEELKEIVVGAEQVSGDMGEIARAIENQANVANRVVEAMGEGSRLTKDNQAEMENLASLSEETSASTEEIGSAAHELNGMANELKETMQRFSF